MNAGPCFRETFGRPTSTLGHLEAELPTSRIDEIRVLSAAAALIGDPSPELRFERNVMKLKAPSLGVPFLTDTRLRLCGGWGRRGLAILQDGDKEVLVEVPPALFDLLAILILEARQPVPASACWIPPGFISPEELVRQLTRRGGGNPRDPWYDGEHIKRAIYRLRQLLAKALFPQKDGTAWSHRFVEYASLGYRLSTAASNLQLAILDTQRDGEGIESESSCRDRKRPNGDRSVIDVCEGPG
jgi:hypothetical protein